MIVPNGVHHFTDSRLADSGSGLFVWKLERLDEADYQQAVAFVVVASSEHDTRGAAGRSRGTETESIWHAPSFTSCTCLGAADEGINPGVVVRDYLEG